MSLAYYHSILERLGQAIQTDGTHRRTVGRMEWCLADFWRGIRPLRPFSQASPEAEAAYELLHLDADRCWQRDRLLCLDTPPDFRLALADLKLTTYRCKACNGNGGDYGETWDEDWSHCVFCKGTGERFELPNTDGKPRHQWIQPEKIETTMRCVCQRGEKWSAESPCHWCKDGRIEVGPGRLIRRDVMPGMDESMPTFDRPGGEHPYGEDDEGWEKLEIGGLHECEYGTDAFGHSNCFMTRYEAQTRRYHAPRYLRRERLRRYDGGPLLLVKILIREAREAMGEPAPLYVGV